MKRVGILFVSGLKSFSFSGLALLLLISFLVSCAAIEKQNAMDMERLLAASGFKLKLADTPKKMAALQGLPQRELVPQEHDGKT